LENILELNKLTKKFGRITAVDELSFSVQKGSVFGILGPNGSGKTTTLGMLLGVTRPLSGSFSWFGGESPQSAKQRIGSLLETPNFYPYMTARQNLKLVAKIKGIKKPNIEEVLEQVKLLERADDKFKTYSLGMKQRLAIASALLGTPEVLVLDEPTNGLDPKGIADIRNLILEIAGRGITVIMASHILAEVEKVCTHVAVLRTGKLLFSGLAGELQAPQEKLAVASENMEALEAALKEHPQIKELQKVKTHLLIVPEESLSPQALNQWLAERHIYLSHLSRNESDFEAGFFKLINK
jgi:ABC-2 type transport system ATP-binding protein